ncbi:hypothetical protein [Calothrix sp. 336/3]|uniref:hypothetical protein n=1 Tax=Calothrix sp. 336/3 TaxID=1337936 RepID=UPI0004E367DC|nr:hypothetical protein [Calothrix sp. 336/3]AKG22222.1 hypothetical protein IJ00_13970 [Calothrix sp. 336/3]
MSENTIENHGKGFLVLLLPISFLVIFLVATWRIWLALFVLILGLNIWQRYQWQQWCQQVNPMFNQLMRETQGKITPMDLAVRGNFPGDTAKRYLDTKAGEFGANIVNSPDGSKIYYFMTASTLGSILDSSEPLKELADGKPVATTAELLLAPPPKKTELTEVTESEEIITPHTETVPSLESQLIFGSLIQSELAKRLNVYSSTVYKRRDESDFSEWTRSRDPDGIAWTYSPETKEFFPLEEQTT